VSRKFKNFKDQKSLIVVLKSLFIYSCGSVAVIIWLIKMIHNQLKIIAVIGANSCDDRIYHLAEQVGAALAQKNLIIICGGLGGVMEGACKGAKSKNGMTIGILPGNNTGEANPYVDIAIATGMGVARNIIIVRSALGVIAINGKYGTLSELAYALQLNKPIVGLETWNVSRQIINAINPEDAVTKICKMVGKK
jgi:uncharacterized protein (TIGR00725 family)